MLKGHQVESKEFAVVAVLREMGWSYQTYLDQPNWVIDALHIALQEEAKYSKVRKPS